MFIFRSTEFNSDGKKAVSTKFTFRCQSYLKLLSITQQVQCLVTCKVSSQAVNTKVINRVFQGGQRGKNQVSINGKFEFQNRKPSDTQQATKWLKGRINENNPPKKRLRVNKEKVTSERET